MDKYYQSILFRITDTYMIIIIAPEKIKVHTETIVIKANLYFDPTSKKQNKTKTFFKKYSCNLIFYLLP